jgi:hypothetical protein
MNMDDDCWLDLSVLIAFSGTLEEVFFLCKHGLAI